jgi:Zn-dependent protease with chaperone function
MIIANFLFFIVAIGVFVTAPVSGTSTLAPVYNIYGLLIVVLGFWHFNRHKFMRLRADVKSETISTNEAKRRFFNVINFHIIIAIILFAVEIYVFDLKKFLAQIPELGQVYTFINAAGLGVFIIHLAVIWYWGFRAMGDVISIGDSPGDYVRSNIKFNFVIVIPWLSFLLLHDLMTALIPTLMARLEESALFQIGYFAGFLLIFSLFAPALITRMWNCKPLENPEIRGPLEAYCRSQGVKFKDIMSWNALNGTLVTAGVIGLVYPFRYLLITPELMNVLDKNDLLGVVSHEVGHVKKKHLLYYLMFFMGFFFLSIGLMGWLNALLVFFLSRDSVNNGLYNYISLFLFFLFLVIYFRLIFGYFMRNFERQADTYCFASGVDPNYLVSSFMKLGVHTGDDGKKRNWHHYSITRRIDFLRRCMDDPGQVARHEKKVKKSIRAFLALLIIASAPFLFYTPEDLYYNLWEMRFKSQIEKEETPELYAGLGQVSYLLKKYEATRNAYEKSLELQYNQPEVLNNLAWLYLTCPDERYLNPGRALTLAEDAIQLQQAPHIFDTLAEAYFRNEMYKKAYRASRRALMTARGNLAYYRKQLKKMYRYYRKFKNLVTI